jgi:hypothetical protein
MLLRECENFGSRSRRELFLQDLAECVAVVMPRRRGREARIVQHVEAVQHGEEANRGLVSGSRQGDTLCRSAVSKAPRTEEMPGVSPRFRRRPSPA